MSTDTLVRLQTRAALFLAPDTLCSATEVAQVLQRDENHVREARPASAYTPPGGRAIVAPWSDWLEALGYRLRPTMPAQPVISADATSECSVYLLSQSDQYKIGISEDPRGRARSLCLSTGRPTLLVGLARRQMRWQAEYDESELLVALHPYRRLGEWFDRVQPVRTTFFALDGAVELS